MTTASGVALRLLCPPGMHNALVLDRLRSNSPAASLAPLLPAFLWGTVLTATLDGLEAATFCALRGIPPVRAIQGVATGLLGRAAFAGGARTALLGGALLAGICAVVVALYLVASRRFAVLAQSPWRFGPLYGAAVFTVMNFVVVPLSAAGGRGLHFYALLNCLLANIACIGVPTALLARAAARTGAMASDPSAPGNHEPGR